MVKRAKLSAIHAESEKHFPEPASSPAKPADKILHQTLYLRRPIHRQLRQLAAIKDCKMHDLILEGLDKIFRENGLKGIADLSDEADLNDATGRANYR